LLFTLVLHVVGAVLFSLFLTDCFHRLTRLIYWFTDAQSQQVTLLDRERHSTSEELGSLAKDNYCLPMPLVSVFDQHIYVPDKEI